MAFYSQDDQDKFLHEHVFKGFRNGSFVDVGAHDGKTYNNTLFFEQTLGWRGVNIEPLPSVFEQLRINRPNCINVNCAIDAQEGTADFVASSGSTEMLSGLVRHYHPFHKYRLDTELGAEGRQATSLQVPTRPLSSVLSDHKIAHVHVLSVDVEGAELAVLQSIDFSKVFIDCIVVEVNYEDRTQAIVDFLQDKGFKVVHRGRLDLFLLHKDSLFNMKH